MSRVWGVGFLPRRWMDRYVRWIRGVPYDKIRLASRLEIRAASRQACVDRLDCFLPTVQEVHWAHLHGAERLAAHLFTAAACIPILRVLLRWISPVIVFVARRS